MCYILWTLVILLLAMCLAIAILFETLYKEEKKRIAAWEASLKLGKEIEE